MEKQLYDPYALFTKTTLSTGLTLFHSQVNRPWVIVRVIIHSGASSDPIGKEGLAHFTEHVVSENGIANEKYMSNFFEENGGYIMLGLTSGCTTEYEFKIPTDKNLEIALKMFGSFLSGTTIENGVEEQRSVISHEFQGKNQYPKLFEEMQKVYGVIYQNTWLSRMQSPIGTLPTIKTITKEDIQLYYDTHYVPRNMSVVSSGGIDADSLGALIKQSFVNCKTENLSVPVVPVVLGSPVESTGRIFTFSSKDLYGGRILENTASYYAVATLPINMNRYAINVASAMLNENLFEKVRKQLKMTYSISCWFSIVREIKDFRIQCSSFDASFASEISHVIAGIITVTKEDKKLFEKKRKVEIASLRSSDSSIKKVVSVASVEVGRERRVVSLLEDIAMFENLKFEDIQQVLHFLSEKYLVHTIVSK